MSNNKSDKDPEEHARQNWYHYKPTKMGKALAYIVVYIFFIAIDTIEVWKVSHLMWSICFVIVTIALLYAEMFAAKVVTSEWFTLSCGAIILFGLGVYLLSGPNIPPLEEPEGWFLPADETMPANGCGRSQIPKSAILFVAGENGAWTTSTERSLVLAVGSDNHLSMQKVGDHIVFSADIYDPKSGNYIHIENNQLIKTPGMYFHSEWSAERDSFTIYDKSGIEQLYIHYANANTFVIRGIFKSKDGAFASVSKSSLVYGNNNTIADNCKAGFYGDNAGFIVTRDGFRM